MFLKHTPRTPNLSPIVVNSCYIICFYLFDSIKSAFADINISIVIVMIFGMYYPNVKTWIILSLESFFSPEFLVRLMRFHSNAKR